MNGVPPLTDFCWILKNVKGYIIWYFGCLPAGSQLHSNPSLLFYGRELEEFQAVFPGSLASKFPVRFGQCEVLAGDFFKGERQKNSLFSVSVASLVSVIT